MVALERVFVFCFSAGYLGSHGSKVDDVDECVVASSQDNLATVVQKRDGIDVISVNSCAKNNLNDAWRRTQLIAA